MKKIEYIDEVEIKNKTILVRVDFDVSLNSDLTIANDIRIQKNLPTLQYLLKNNNRVICVAKLNRPKQRDPKHSLKIVVERLKEYLPKNKITLINDFLTEKKEIFINQKSNEILVLENIRFYPEEKKGDPLFAKKLASLANIYVGDGFAVIHRAEASVVGITQYLPSYGGLLLKKEIEMITKATKNPKRPLVAIIAGAKISTKIGLIEKLLEIADYVLIGGAMANTFWKAKGLEVGKSLIETEFIDQAKKLIVKGEIKNNLIIPIDCLIGKPEDQSAAGIVKKNNNLGLEDIALDIGPDTIETFKKYIQQAKTVIWNGPVGYFENVNYRIGTDAIYNTIVDKIDIISVVGGGDTLTAIKNKTKNDKITHISTGGGAMLELIEKGTLPGIEALKK